MLNKEVFLFCIDSRLLLLSIEFKNEEKEKTASGC